MTYLIAEIWTLAAVSALLGLFVGWLFRGGVLAARVRELKSNVQQSLAEGAAQQQEAARLAAQIERGANRDNTTADDQAARLDEHLAEARSVAEREAAAADELREKTRLLEAQLAAVNDGEHEPPAVAEEPEGVDELRGQIARLTARLADAEPAANVVGELRQQIVELERSSPAALAVAPDTSEDEAALRDRVDELERELTALAEGDQATFMDAQDVEDDSRRAYWLAARNRWLERKLEDMQGGELPQPSTAEAEVIELRARVVELESADAPVVENTVQDVEDDGVAQEAVGEADEESELVDVEQLRWRNRYLTSRVRYLERRKSDNAEHGSTGQHEENERLRRRVADLENAMRSGPSGAAGELQRLRGRLVEFENAERLAAQSDGATQDDDKARDVYSMEWRNKYLSSRVRYLERRVSEMDRADASSNGSGPGGEGEVERLRAQIDGLKAQAEEVARLRNRLNESPGENGEGDNATESEVGLLRSRVSELEQTLRGAEIGSETGESVGEGGNALAWRNRYLSSRVKYLEERLAEARLTGEVGAG